MTAILAVIAAAVRALAHRGEHDFAEYADEAIALTTDDFIEWDMEFVA